MNHQNKLFPYINIDIYNEELNRVINLDNLCNDFRSKIKNIQPKNKTDLNYSQEIKNSLGRSIDKIQNFLNIKKNLLLKQIEKKKVPLKENTIEHFEDRSCNNIEEVSNIKFLISFSLLFIILFYLLI